MSFIDNLYKCMLLSPSIGYTSLWAHTPRFYVLCIQQQSNATYATYFSFCKAAVKYTVIPLAQPLRPMLRAKVYTMIPAVCCCPSVLTRHCVRCIALVQSIFRFGCIHWAGGLGCF